MAFRVDIGSLRSLRTIPTGIRVDAYITRPGVFPYRQADGSIRLELRDDVEVFDSESLSSFELLPVTDDHPPVALDASNATTYARGAVGEAVRRDGGMVAAPLTIYDASLITKMKAGKSQTSCGYTCDINPVPGTHPVYGKYHVSQTNIRGNHLAIVDAGRMGPAVHARMDAVDAAFMITATEDKKMEELQKQLAAALREAAEQRARADMAEIRVVEANTRVDVAEALALGEKARADAADKIRTDTANGFAAAVSARVSLVSAAASVLRTDKAVDDVSALSDRAIKIAMIKRIDNIDVPEGRSDDFVDALYMSASTRAQAAASSLSALRGDLNDRRDTSGLDPEVAAMRAMMAHNAALSRTAQGA